MTFKKDFWEEITTCIDNLVENGWRIKEKDLIKFRDKNKEKVTYLIKNDKISDEEFKLISNLIDQLWIEFSVDDNLEPIPVFQDILKTYISLALKFNSRLERYINKLDHRTAYFKRIKSLQMIRFYKWPIDEFIYIFGDICYLLWESIEQEPQKARESYNIMKEYLTILDSYWILSWVTNFMSLYKYSDPKYRIKILSNKSFSKRFYEFEKEVCDYTHIDEDSLNRAIEEKIKNMKNNWYNIPDKNIIYKYLEPQLKKYKDIKQEYDEQCKITDNITEDMLSDFIYEYQPEDSIEESKNYVKFFLDSKDRLSKKITRIIIKFPEEVEEDEQKHIINELKKEFQYPVVNDKDVEFSGEREYIKLWNLQSWVEHYYYETISYLVGICSNQKSIINEDINDNEFEKDIKELEWAKNIIEKLQKKLEDYEKIDKDKDEKISELIDKKLKLESIIEKNKIDDDRYWEEIDIKEKRKLYKITVIWWNDRANKKYHNVMKDIKTQKLLSDLYLSEQQFDLVWSYEKQKNTSIKKKVEDDLIFGRINFIIALQTDHSTELIDLINDIRNENGKYHDYQYRLTIMWEPWDDWKELYHNQTVTSDRIIKYIKRALNKYEAHQENNIIGL